MIEFCGVIPGKPSVSIINVAGKFLETQPSNGFKGGFAFVTVAGVNALLSNLSSAAWPKLEKKIIVGIHQGITEPEAIRKLQAEKGFDVRVYIPNGKLTSQSVFELPMFHPKVMLFEPGSSDGVGLLAISSANLTGAAVGKVPKNIECGQVARIKSNQAVYKEFNSWWGDLWRAAQPVNEALLKQYAKHRTKVFIRNPDLIRATDGADRIEQASHFWIEVGKANGILRHQVEFPKHLARFFGKTKKHRVDLILATGTKTWVGRPLSHKVTTYGVNIWRLGMPTTTKSGPPIQHRVICFTRTPDPLKYSYEVADVGSPKANSWMEECSLKGHLGRTHGTHPRKYGYR